MSQLAKKLPSPDAVRTRVRKGPSGLCDIYGDGDLEDWRAIRVLQGQTSWADTQRAVDQALGITTPIDTDKFRYHWGKRCWHWTQEQRQASL